jgi:hypothetical protein
MTTEERLELLEDSLHELALNVLRIKKDVESIMKSLPLEKRVAALEGQA